MEERTKVEKGTGGENSELQKISSSLAAVTSERDRGAYRTRKRKEGFEERN